MGQKKSKNVLTIGMVPKVRKGKRSKIAGFESTLLMDGPSYYAPARQGL
jgi:hypothetical protein